MSKLQSETRSREPKKIRRERAAADLARFGPAVAPLGPRTPSVPLPARFLGTPTEQRAAATKESMWRQVTLTRQEGTISTDCIAIFERTDGIGPSVDEQTLRVWFRGLVDQSPWWRLENVSVEQALVLRIDFPQDEFYGMPVHLFVERPGVLETGAGWVLHAEDRKRVTARFSQHSDTLLPWREVQRIERFYEDW